MDTNKIRQCGDCGRFEAYEEKETHDWEGYCNALGIGRNEYTRACDSDSIRLKEGAVERPRG